MDIEYIDKNGICVQASNVKMCTNKKDNNDYKIYEGDTILYKYIGSNITHKGKVVRESDSWLIESSTEACKPFLNSRALEYTYITLVK